MISLRWFRIKCYPKVVNIFKAKFYVKTVYTRAMEDVLLQAVGHWVHWRLGGRWELESDSYRIELEFESSCADTPTPEASEYGRVRED